ncbi:MAG: cytochrome c1 [Planctomycetota bacterium]|nr:MAG: cytochrome c1 [Planctomycetota bacterium]
MRAGRFLDELRPAPRTLSIHRRGSANWLCAFGISSKVAHMLRRFLPASILVLVSGWMLVVPPVEALRAADGKPLERADDAPPSTARDATDVPAVDFDHPMIPGFERFYGPFAERLAKRQLGPIAEELDEEDLPPRPVRPDLNTPAEVVAGLLLAGELNCASCHAAAGDLAELLQTKQAPVLDQLGDRLRPQFVRSFVEAPQSAKPGTTMPTVARHLPPAERRAATEAITHFLMAEGTSVPNAPVVAAASRGKALFRQLGCVACHGLPGHPTAELPTSVPLGDLARKYHILGLQRFLKQPHATRPSARMPRFPLDDKQARDLANYLAGGPAAARDALKYRAYHGVWEKLPDFTKLRPTAEGVAGGFDLSLAGRKDDFGLRFEGFLHIPTAGKYQFALGSDDGSRLWIDGRAVLEVDGIHPYSKRSTSLRLTAGVHPIAVDYFERGGEEVLTVEIAGPGLPQQSLISFVTATPEPIELEPTLPGEEPFTLRRDLIPAGKEHFEKLGCAACHRKTSGGKPLQNRRAAKPFASLKPAPVGCLAPKPPAEVPDYSLSEPQRRALVALIAAVRAAALPKPAGELVNHLTMARFNCYACHDRNGIGGVEFDRNPFFEGVIKEMGDEGRIPPTLTGVGDKLRKDWMAHLFENGAADRPYMRTRMPRFGRQNVGHLVDSFAATDEKNAAVIPRIDLPVHRIKAIGRHLVGADALSCIKCHNFGKYKATGIQAIDLTTMSRRLRSDWFHRYLLDPQAFRPGTRMPAAWPFGRSTIPDVLGGDAHAQIHAVWVYLSDGPKAAIPKGLIPEKMVLVPKDEPIIYRNFIEGLHPRGIAVGYPEKVNLAFDADDLSLALIWHNAFIDAGRHWTGRGQGFQPPLGDHVLSLPRGAAFAVLSGPDQPWPEKPAKALGNRFRGYRLDKLRRPTFLYEVDGVRVEDHCDPLPTRFEPGLKRTLRVTPLHGPNAEQRLFYRAAAGKLITQDQDGWFVVDEMLRIRVHAPVQPQLRQVGGRQELILSLGAVRKPLTIVQEYVW